ncbi:MAG: hypothetical protein QNJ53_20205 [Pleurocapsa sp. MO_192.B19]|nr:hypothetical protein [Pleurocapsa sp. MO_192.B19]
MIELQIQPLNFPEKYQNSESEIDDAIQRQIYGGGIIDDPILDIALATANTPFSRALIGAALDGDNILGNVVLDTSP